MHPPVIRFAAESHNIALAYNNICRISADINNKSGSAIRARGKRSHKRETLDLKSGYLDFGGLKNRFVPGNNVFGNSQKHDSLALVAPLVLKLLDTEPLNINLLNVNGNKLASLEGNRPIRFCF